MTDYRYQDVVDYVRGSTRPAGKCLGLANNDIVGHFGKLGNTPWSATAAADELARAGQLYTSACPDYPHVDFYYYKEDGVEYGHVDWHFPQHGVHIADSGRITVKLNAKGTVGTYPSWGPRRGWAKVPALNAQVSFVNDPAPQAPSGGGLDIDTIARQVIAGQWGNGDDRKNRLQAAGYDYNAVQGRVNAILSQPTGNGPQIYTVQRGDTLSKIGVRYHKSWQAIYNANRGVIGGNPNVIRPGMRLTIPA